jgi:hippurate hydrolase
VDSTLIAAQLVVAIQSIVSRNADPVRQLVLSVTSFQTSSTAYNIIPQTVHLKGTMRSLGADMRELGEARLRAVCAGVAATYGGEVDLQFHPGYPSVVNAPEQTEFAASVASAVSGTCDDAPLIMWGEDFAYFLEARPGAYIWMGVGDTASLHHPEYNFNDEVIPAGCSWFAEIVERRMPAA